MNILYLGPFRFPEGDAAASRVLNNSRLLRDLGHFVRVISFGGQYRSEDKNGKEYMYDSIPYLITNDIDSHSWKERCIRYIAPYPSARKYVREHIREYDVIIVYNATLPFNLFIQRIGATYHKKIVLDITEWPASNETPGGKFFLPYWMSEINMRVIQKRYKNLIAISSFLHNYYNNRNQILIPPLVDVQESKWNHFMPIDDDRILNHSGIKILFAGTPAKKDLLGNLIKALLAIFPDSLKIQLIVAGVSSEQAIAYCDQASLTKYYDNLVFLGKIPQRLVPSYYSIANLSAIIREASRKNTAGFPTKMAESMAAGCPVLTNPTSDLNQYLRDKENAIIIDGPDVCNIEVGLRRILNMDIDDLNAMRIKARYVGERFFDYRSYISDMTGFIENLE